MCFANLCTGQGGFPMIRKPEFERDGEGRVDVVLLTFGNSVAKKNGRPCRAARVKVRTVYITCFTGGMVQEPSRIEGGVSLGQYRRSIRMNLSAGAGSQLDSLSLPG
jgi:hypothetical protein